jgi:hypothetical protein
LKRCNLVPEVTVSLSLVTELDELVPRLGSARSSCELLLLFVAFVGAGGMERSFQGFVSGVKGKGVKLVAA